MFASSLHGLMCVCTTRKLCFMFTFAQSVSMLLALKESWRSQDSQVTSKTFS